MPRLLLLLPTKTYRGKDFLDAARRLGIEVTVASEEPSTMQKLAPDALLTLDLYDPEAAGDDAFAFARRVGVDAVLGVDEPTVHAAACIARDLGLPHNSPEAAFAAGNKLVMRQKLQAAGLPVPGFTAHSLDEAPSFVTGLRFPCVLKPLVLSASRGVIRADDAEAARAAFQRIRALMDEPRLAARHDPAARSVLVEDYLPGRELALEGLLQAGALRVLALFDKPDPLEGPVFAETIYVTPSRLPAAEQEGIAATVGAAARALGIHDGPLHAEVRVNERGVFVLECAARTIGGLCSRTLRFGTGMSLEEVVLRHAFRLEIPKLERERAAAGVYMLPVPRRGKLRAIDGVEAARAVEYIVEVTITSHVGQEVVPLPEGDAYLGFVFARASDPATVEAALRRAVRELRFEIV
jgi:biotin carboxylase